MEQELKELELKRRAVKAKTLAVLVEIRLKRRPSSRILRLPENALKNAYWLVVEALTMPSTFGDLGARHSFNPEWLKVTLLNLMTIGHVRDRKGGPGELTLWELAPASHDRALDPAKVDYFVGDIYL